MLTIAVAECLLESSDFAQTLHAYGRRYPNAGYGGRFASWLQDAEPRPYGSFGNGSAMRVGPVGFAARDLGEALALAAASASVTHDHPEGIRGAQVIGGAVFLARTGASKDDIRDFVSGRFGYDLDFTLAERRPEATFDVTCQGSVPEAVVAFLEGKDVEHSIRLAISLGGDSDTQACMAGAIAAAFHRAIPDEIVAGTRQRLPEEFLDVLDRFAARYSPLTGTATD